MRKLLLPLSVDAEDALIAAFIANHGVTKCPLRYASVSSQAWPA